MESKNKNSKAYFSKAQKVLVGGVNSPVRAFRAVKGNPIFIEKANGPYLIDVDNNTYIDYVGSWGPMILGHNPPEVVKAIEEAIQKGTSFGAPSVMEISLAELIISAFPSIERIRMTTSGTEATMTAIRLARGYTKRERIMKFEGGYHGHSDSLLVSAGSGATTFGVPSSAGVPESLAKNTWVLPFNDEKKLAETFRTQGPNIAAVIVEPISGNMGVVPPTPTFLQKLRDLCTQFGTVLIFDEVMTGFRVTWGGAQTIYSVQPDLTCLGKIIGGGFPVGAVGGKKEIMSLLAPEGPVYQAGTLSGNPISMAAGHALLSSLKESNPYVDLEEATKNICDSALSSAKKEGVALVANRIGSMFTLFFSESPITDYLSALQSDSKLYGKFFHALLEQGVYFPPSQFEAAFVGAAHTPEIINKTTEAISAAIKAVR